MHGCTDTMSDKLADDPEVVALDESLNRIRDVSDSITRTSERDRVI